MHDIELHHTRIDGDLIYDAKTDQWLGKLIQLADGRWEIRCVQIVVGPQDTALMVLAEMEGAMCYWHTDEGKQRKAETDARISAFVASAKE